MVAFYRAKDNAEIYKRVLENDDGMWLIDYQHPSSPFKVFVEGISNLTLIPVPDGYLEERHVSQKRRDTRDKRVGIISPLIHDSECIRNRTLRKKVIESLAEKNNMSPRTVQKWYFKYLAWGKTPCIQQKGKGRNNPCPKCKEHPMGNQSVFLQQQKNVAKRSL